MTLASRGSCGAIPILFIAALLVTAVGCGNGSKVGDNPIAPPGNNVQPISVNAGPASNSANGAFTSVKVCVPGSTTECQTINGVLIDTGSSGLRVLASALTLALPQQVSGTTPIAECNQFQDGFTWGPIKAADIIIASEQANSVPMQVIGDPAFPTVPTPCKNAGIPSEDTLATLGANGVLGVGPFVQDCGPGCASTANNVGLYYACPSSGCIQTAEPLSAQVQNPVAFFPTDNNGVIIELPAIPAAGAPTVSGSLVFGIGTQSNNGLSNATVLGVDPSNATFTTVFKNISYGAFIDSGSNGLFFLDSAGTALSVCTDNSSFYCPPNTRSFSATNQGTNGTSSNVSFNIANADTLFSNLAATAFNNLGGPNPNQFDWGMPFFYGRNVFTAIEGQNTPAGPGPYFAY